MWKPSKLDFDSIVNHQKKQLEVQSFLCFPDTLRRYYFTGVYHVHCSSIQHTYITELVKDKYCFPLISNLFFVFSALKIVPTSLKASDRNPVGAELFPAGCICCNMKWNQYGRHAETHSGTHLGFISISIHFAMFPFKKG